MIFKGEMGSWSVSWRDRCFCVCVFQDIGVELAGDQAFGKGVRDMRNFMQRAVSGRGR